METDGNKTLYMKKINRITERYHNGLQQYGVFAHFYRFEHCLFIVVEM